MAGRRRKRRPNPLIEAADGLDALLDVGQRVYNIWREFIAAESWADNPYRRLPPTAAPEARLDPYKVLGMEPGLPIEAKKRRYKTLQGIVHPDKGGDTELAKLINWAWQEVCTREGIK